MMVNAVVSELKEYVEGVIETHGGNPGDLIQILREIQDNRNYLSPQTLRDVAEELGLSSGYVLGVAEFYSFFYTTQKGRYHILFSDSITDRMLGKEALMMRLCERLGIAVGETRRDGRVSVDNTSCTGVCDQGPAILVNGYPLTRLTVKRIDRIVSLVEQNVPLDQWPEGYFTVADNIRRKGLLLDGVFEPGVALQTALQKGQDAILGEIRRSGLKGRGGAGFNTAMKWEYCRQESGEHFVVCNADEGEPGTFKDRVLLQSYAHQVIEGMTLCAFVIGARRGFIYLRSEYRYLLEALQGVLEQRHRSNLLGNSILESDDLNFDIQIHLGAGAYICGEESALIESLEGKRGIPRNRPPYPVSHGYLGQPTVVNNVETFAAAANIGLKGGDWFAAVGTPKSSGTKILSISGDCAHPGIYEFPYGVTIEHILQQCGAEEILGVQVGGPSGTFISEQETHRCLGFDDLATGGSFMVFNKERDVLEIVRNFTHFFAHESCGFCTPCRVGTSLIKDQIDKICAGHGSAGDLAQVTQLAGLVKNASHCGLGQTAPNVVLDTLERFPECYEHRLKELSFEPGFDLDDALEISRQMTGRDDAGAHLEQGGI